MDEEMRCDPFQLLLLLLRNGIECDYKFWALIYEERQTVRAQK